MHAQGYRGIARGNPAGGPWIPHPPHCLLQITTAGCCYGDWLCYSITAQLCAPPLSKTVHFCRSECLSVSRCVCVCVSQPPPWPCTLLFLAHLPSSLGPMEPRALPSSAPLHSTGAGRGAGLPLPGPVWSALPCLYEGAPAFWFKLERTLSYAWTDHNPPNPALQKDSCMVSNLWLLQSDL